MEKQFREEQERDPVTGALNRKGYMHYAAKILAANPEENVLRY